MAAILDAVLDAEAMSALAGGSAGRGCGSVTGGSERSHAERGLAGAVEVVAAGAGLTTMVRWETALEDDDDDDDLGSLA